jgi:glycosyltransferase involved in cell wall biosynthesis
MAQHVMKILMVQTFYYYRGGDCTYMFNLSKLLEERGHEVVPFAMRHPQNLPSPYERHFTPEIDFPALLAEFSPRAAWTVLTHSIHNREARRNIAVLIDEVKPDIAHFHNIHSHLTTSIIGPLYRRGIPIVWTLHDYRLICPNTTFLSHGEICERCLPSRFYEVLLHRCKKESLTASLVAMLAIYYERLNRAPRRVQHFITPSGFLKGKLIEGGFDPGRITPIPNFVDLDAYAPGEEKHYFLYFGRLSHEKGVDTLIQAVAALDRGELWIVGEGPAGEDLRSLAAELGTERIRFKGYRRGDELKRILSGAQFIVLPSRWYENLPFSIMEAFACSRPVVASDVGGIPEMVEDGVNGYLFPLRDVDALVGRLGAMLDDPARRREMGRRAREKAERLYNREEHYRRIEEIYRRVLAEQR